MSPGDRRARGRRLRRLGYAGVLLLSLVAVDARSDVVVREPGPEGAEIGLEAGDVLAGWRPAAEPESSLRPIASWADPWRLDRFEIPRRGPLDLEIRRGGDNRIVRTRALALDLDVAPALAAERIAALDGRATAEPAAGEDPIAALRAAAAADGAEALTWALARLAQAATRRGEFETAHQALLAAAEAAPPDLAAELLQRAAVALERQLRYDEAAELHRQALERWQRLEPDGLGASLTLSALGNLENRRHRLAEGQKLHQRALEIRQRRAPGSYLVAGALNNLGVVAGRRNDLATAESRLVEALELNRRLGAGPIATAALSNLGVVARLRGELDRAERYTLDAIAELEARGELDDAAVKRANLANIVSDRGDYRRAIEIWDRIIEVDYARVHDAYYLPDAHANRAMVHHLRGDLDAAEADLRRARELLGEARRDTPLTALIVQNFAEIAFDRGELERAAAQCAEALTGWARLRPDSTDQARTASLCARIAAARGEWQHADELFARSIELVELQQRRIGGGERGLVAFRRKLRAVYRDYVGYLVTRGRPRAAFEVNERYRAQALRALLAQRDLDLGAQVPDELRAERERLGREIERAYARLARLPEGAVELATLRAEIADLHLARDEVATRARRASKALAGMESPPLLPVDEMARGLPAGTVALVYDVAGVDSRVFVLAGDGTVEVHPLAADEPELARLVERWSERVARPRTSVELSGLSRTLGETLLGPAAARIAGARRLLVVPDGPLHALSFAALPAPAGPPGSYLIERLPLVRDVSVSVFVASLAGDRRAAKPEVLVFGDPAASQVAASRYRGEFGSLPASRREAAAIAGLFGDRARIFIGAEATEESARAHLPSAGVAHFACHAAVDELLPLDSALVLAPDDSSGGLLQAWEIAEELRLDGALVVLSACETARGGERAGEGIVGLVRAFQVAGAESIVASLWRISDESTAELMRRFYARLERGADRDEALRQAQLELLRGPIEIERDGERVRIDASAPRHWAPFVLLGAPGGGGPP